MLSCNRHSVSGQTVTRNVITFKRVCVLKLFTTVRSTRTVITEYLIANKVYNCINIDVALGIWPTQCINHIRTTLVYHAQYTHITEVIGGDVAILAKNDQKIETFVKASLNNFE